jgi:PTH1 family peptidyl-tRNA hydrolase
MNSKEPTGAQDSWLIVGLGNPGDEYVNTRHNIGFALVDYLASQSGAKVKRRECRSLIGQSVIEGTPVELVKPQTYMNLSGESISCLLKKNSRSHERMIVISDDLALPIGRLRIRASGSAGGHNGLKSVIESLGSNSFARLRIGIAPNHPISDAHDFVLGKFSKEERTQVENILKRGVDALHTMLRSGIGKAMAEFNAAELVLE